SGWTGNPSFTDDAFDGFFEASGGVPRRLNTVASRALMAAAFDGVTEIDGALVGDVVSDLEADNAMPQRDSFHQQVNAVTQKSVESESELRLLTRRLDAHDRVIKQLLSLVSELSEQVEAQAAAQGSVTSMGNAAE
ncbi:MAG: ATPase, partial [Pacificimonas sp.]